MSLARGFVSSTAGILLFVTIVCAQGQNPASNTGSTIAVTAAANADRVRFTAPISVVQMRLEIYAVNGEKLFDNEIRGGNVIDWHLQNGQAEPLADGSYLCVVTVKTLSGRITQRIASATIEKTIATLQTATASQLTPRQSGVVGPIEDDASLILLKEDDHQTTTVIAHNGEDGQITRGRGALSFRLGDFFRGMDTEQMRLTVEGNLGIGVANPQAKLDVAGAIRASQGIIFPDGSIQFSAARKTFGTPSLKDGQSKDKSGEGQGIRPEIAGTGTTGRIPKWQDGPTGVLTDSVITELNGSIGINGPPSPTFKLDVNGHNRFRGSNVSFYLTGARPGGNEWLFQTVDADGRLRIFENSAGGGERLSLTQSGNVGIGTSNPSAKLYVQDSDSSPTADIAQFFANNLTQGIGIGYNRIEAVGSATNQDILLLPKGSGNVGIGDAPLAKLYVRDSDNASTADIARFLANNLTQGIGIGYNRIEAIGSSANQDILLMPKAAGNVGIGADAPGEKLTVTGRVQSTSGGFKFPDGSVQTTAANLTYTTARDVNVSLNGSLQSVIHLNLPAGTYRLGATVAFYNHANFFGQDNNRYISCQFSGDQYYEFHLPGLGDATVHFDSLLNITSGGVDLECHLTAGNDSVVAHHSRLTAVKIEGNVVVQ